jgi:hypothetical protein
MDPIQYDKIADKLMQFRGKLPDANALSSLTARSYIDAMKSEIDLLLESIDRLAAFDEDGWIR